MSPEEQLQVMERDILRAMVMRVYHVEASEEVLARFRAMVDPAMLRKAAEGDQKAMGLVLSTFGLPPLS